MSGSLDLLLLLILGHSLVLHAETKSVRVHHRIFHPSIAPVPYTLKATVDTSGPTLDHSAGATNDLHAFSQIIRGVDDALYQVALESDDLGTSQTDWVVSSVKACHLRSAISDTVILYMSTTHEAYNLDYFVSPVPHDGSCPDSLVEARPVLSNTTVHVWQPRLPPLPELRTPPPLTPQGEVVQPEPEQSFLQKYWMYMVGALLVMILAPSPPEEGERSGQARAAPGR